MPSKGDSAIVAAGEQLGQAARFGKLDAAELLEAMEQRRLRIETQVRLVKEEMFSLERENRILRYKCDVLKRQIEWAGPGE